MNYIFKVSSLDSTPLSSRCAGVFRCASAYWQCRSLADDAELNLCAAESLRRCGAGERAWIFDELHFKVSSLDSTPLSSRCAGVSLRPASRVTVLLSPTISPSLGLSTAKHVYSRLCCWSCRFTTA
jgi:hypothetical protein